MKPPTEASGSGGSSNFWIICFLLTVLLGSTGYHEIGALQALTGGAEVAFHEVTDSIEKDNCSPSSSELAYKHSFGFFDDVSEF